MNEYERLAFKAADSLHLTVEYLEKLCILRINRKMSVSKYRRLIQELNELSKLLAVYNRSDVDNSERR